MKKVLLIDGNNVAYRNYYAQNLTTTTGQKTGMIYGTVNSILTTNRDIQPDITIVVWDPPNGAAHRQNMYKLYKGNRESQGPEFYEEKELLQALLHAMGVRQITKDGVETDDVIGWLAKYKYADAEVYVLSNDKDLYQVASEHCYMWHPEKGKIALENGKIAIKEQGKTIMLKPEQVADFKALVGDSSDNYPGMPGFGIGAAITYFASNSNAEAILDGTADLRGLRSQALSGIMAGRAMLQTFKDIAVLHYDRGEGDVPEKPVPNRLIVDELLIQLEFNQFRTYGDKVYAIGGKE